MTAAAPMHPVIAPEQRRAVEQLVCDLPGGRPGELAFEQPWEIRAFALAVAAHKAGRYDWQQFQQALIGSITQWEAENPTLDGPSWSYYEHWVSALEDVLDETGLFGVTDVDRRTAEVLASPPNRNHHEAHLEPVAVDPAAA